MISDKIAELVRRLHKLVEGYDHLDDYATLICDAADALEQQVRENAELIEHLRFLQNHYNDACDMAYRAMNGWRAADAELTRRAIPLPGEPDTRWIDRSLRYLQPSPQPDPEAR